MTSKQTITIPMTLAVDALGIVQRARRKDHSGQRSRKKQATAHALRGYIVLARQAREVQP
jgi:hypothetical protein